MRANLLTTDQVAARLHRAPYSVRVMINRGDLRASKDGTRWLISESDLDEYQNSRSTRPARSRRLTA